MKINIKKEKRQKSGPNGDRTHDLQIISLALYRLSYRTNLVSLLSISPLISVHWHYMFVQDAGRPRTNMLAFRLSCFLKKQKTMHI